MAYQMSRPPISLGLEGPVHRDVWLILIVLFASFSLSAFDSLNRWLDLLRLSEDAWRRGFLWQVLTYPAAPYFKGVFFLLSLFVIFLFGRSLFERLSRRSFWRLFALATVCGGGAALLTQALLGTLMSNPPAVAFPFYPLQGELMVMVIVTAAFSILSSEATILLFFVLPLPARLLIPLEIILSFVAFLATKDFASFVGICAAIGAVVYSLRGRSKGRGFWRDLRERYERWRVRRRARKWQKKHGIRLVEPPSDPRWLN